MTPVPSEHLLKQGKLVLAEPLDAVQTDIRIRKSELFAVPLTLNGLQIGKELISFGKVEGDGAIENPQFTTPEGVIKFPCTVKEHQYLLYTFDGKAVVTDKNYNVVQTVVPEGEALMPAGTSAVSFSCSLISEDAPDVVIRFMTLGEPETVEVC